MRDYTFSQGLMSLVVAGLGLLASIDGEFTAAAICYSALFLGLIIQGRED